MFLKSRVRVLGDDVRRRGSESRRSFLIVMIHRLLSEPLCPDHHSLFPAWHTFPATPAYLLFLLHEVLLHFAYLIRLLHLHSNIHAIPQLSPASGLRRAHHTSASVFLRCS